MTLFPAKARFLLAAAMVASCVASAAETNAPPTASATNESGTNAPAASTTATNAPPVESTAEKSPETSVEDKPAVATEVSTNAPAAPAPTRISGKKVEFAEFRLIGDRNIFNPNRSPRSNRGGRGGPERKPVKIETFTLVGLMTYDRGDVAYFDSSASAFRKSVRTNDTIAGYRVTSLTPTEAKLEADGKTIVAHVGTKFRRTDGGPWETAAAGGTFSVEPKPETASADGSKDVEPSSDDATDKETSGGGSGGAVNDVLKRLMQKREQETKNEKQ